MSIIIIKVKIKNLKTEIRKKHFFPNIQKVAEEVKRF